MRRNLEVALILFAITGLIVVSSAQVLNNITIGSYGTIKQMPWLSVDGQWIVNDENETVALRGGGGSYVAYAENLNSDRWDQLEQFFQEVKSVGGNCYRLAFNPVHRDGDTWDLKMTEYNPEFMDKTLALCEKYGIYAILTCMQWQGSGDPDEWMLLPNYKDYWIETWVSIAERYKDRSIVAGYELCNEAWSYSDMALECMDAILEVDQNHMFFVIESVNTPWGVDRMEAGLTTTHTWEPEQLRPNTVYTFHHWWGYPRLSKPYISTEYEMGAVAASVFVETMKNYREYYNVPVLAGEFGTYDYNMDTADSEHVREIIRLCEEEKIGWWYWMMEKLVRDSGLTMAQQIEETFPNPTYPNRIIQQFDPKPFVLADKIVAYGPRAQQITYTWWGSTYRAIAGQDAWIELEGPCTVRVREWESSIWGGTLTDDYLITIQAGQTQRIDFGPYKEVFAYSIP